MKIYITRHSKTIWNMEKRLQGRKDSPLTHEGIENAKALKTYLTNQSFDFIFSSPILRAYSTAQIIFDSYDIIQDERLAEMNFGIFEGRKITDILNTDFELYDQLWHDPARFTRIPEGESYDEVIERAQSFIEDLKKLPIDSHVMIVTHGMFFIVFLATLLGYEKKDFVLFNQKFVDGCSLTCLDFDGQKFLLEYYNECSYLPYVANESFSR